MSLINCGWLNIYKPLNITSSNTESLSSDKCYTDKSGGHFCSDNTRLQLIPPKLISDPNSCYALNNVGIYKDNNGKNIFII